MKYELTENKKTFINASGKSQTLTQIRAIHTFTVITGTVVKAGSLGGWIETEDNLSQEGSCWLDESSEAMNQSQIKGNAFLEGSSIFDEATVTDNSHIQYSALSDSTFVCGESWLQSSCIYGNSLLGGHCRVLDSHLTNVRLSVGTSEKKAWCTYYFRKVELIGDSRNGGGFEIFVDCHWTHVELVGKKFIIHAPTILRYVTGMDLTYVLVEQTLTMEYVFLHDNSTIRVKGGKTGETTICGNEGEPEKEWIQIDSNNFHLKDTEIRDNVSITGKWILSNTELSGYASLVNNWTHQHVLSNSRIKEFAEVVCHENYRAGTVSKTLTLQMDDRYVIA